MCQHDSQLFEFLIAIVDAIVDAIVFFEIMSFDFIESVFLL